MGSIFAGRVSSFLSSVCDLLVSLMSHVDGSFHRLKGIEALD